MPAQSQKNSNVPDRGFKGCLQQPIRNLKSPAENVWTIENSGASAAGSLQAQASRLSDRRIPLVQRQVMAAKIGYLRGNRHLQRVISRVQANHRHGSRQVSPTFSIRPSYYRPTIQRYIGLVEQPAPGEGGKEYAGATGMKAFTPLEKMWIDDVLMNPVIRLLFAVYDSVPPAVIHRVQEINNTTKGQYSPQSNEMALADPMYPKEETFDELDETILEEDRAEISEEEREEAFKGTLLHEMFHYIENHTSEIKEQIPLPKDLIYTMRDPTRIGLPEYAFGWFEHPDNGRLLHFDLQGIMATSGDYSIFDDEELVKVYQSKKWEHSPMPESGGKIAIEEDLAESFSMALLSEESREQLKSKYPLRYILLRNYTKRLEELYLKSQQERLK